MKIAGGPQAQDTQVHWLHWQSSRCWEQGKGSKVPRQIERGKRPPQRATRQHKALHSWREGALRQGMVQRSTQPGIPGIKGGPEERSEKVGTPQSRTMLPYGALTAAMLAEARGRSAAKHTRRDRSCRSTSQDFPHAMPMSLLGPGLHRTREPAGHQRQDGGGEVGR